MVRSTSDEPQSFRSSAAACAHNTRACKRSKYSSHLLNDTCAHEDDTRIVFRQLPQLLALFSLLTHSTPPSHFVSTTSFILVLRLSLRVGLHASLRVLDRHAPLVAAAALPVAAAHGEARLQCWLLPNSPLLYAATRLFAPRTDALSSELGSNINAKPTACCCCSCEHIRPRHPQ